MSDVDQLALFEDMRPVPVDEPTSPGRRRTQRARAALARGQHPATGLPLSLNDLKCGTCVHHQVARPGNKTYHKCDVHRLGESHSEASDIRVGWPACMAYRSAT